jgi:hypothetical protein
MATILNAVSGTGLTQTGDSSGVIKVQSNGVTTNALAWVNFDGTTTPASIRAAYNISSVTRTATGFYTIAFLNSLADANYVAAGMTGGSSNAYMLNKNSSAPQTSFALYVHTGIPGTSDNNDSQVQVAIFGN